MSLSKKEISRKNYLLEKYKRNLTLLPSEAEELKDLINKDDTLDESIKLLITFGLGALIGYLLSKKD